jgi:alpha-tubulin suppressor-like RCC1 family protein
MGLLAGVRTGIAITVVLGMLSLLAQRWFYTEVPLDARPVPLGLMHTVRALPVALKRLLLAESIVRIGQGLAANYYDDVVLWQTQEDVDTESEEEEDPGFPLSVGDAHSCAGKDDSTVWCWGGNSAGELGDGTTTDRLSPVEATEVPDFVSGATGTNHTCIVKADGTAWCWGENALGSTGDGTTTHPRLSPVQVSGLTGVEQVSPGEGHTCALKSDGTVWCWGYNDYGQVGDNSMTQRNVPVQVSGLTNVAHVQAGDFLTCAIKQDETAWCWGANDAGQLGDGSNTERHTPVQVSGLTGVSKINPATHHTCAVKTNGEVWCWGDGTYNELGSNPTSWVPVQVSEISGAVDVAMGHGHSCALKDDGTVWCWGLNWVWYTGWYGSLGMGSGNLSEPPQQVPGLTDVAEIGAGDHYTCAKKNDGTIWCWGTGDAGQIGDGDTDSEGSPVQVLNFP